MYPYSHELSINTYIVFIYNKVEYIFHDALFHSHIYVLTISKITTKRYTLARAQT